MSAYPLTWFYLVPRTVPDNFQAWLGVIGRGPFPVGCSMRSRFQRWREFNNMDVSHFVQVYRMHLGPYSWALLIYYLPTSFCILYLQDSLCFVRTNESVLWQVWEEAEARCLTLLMWGSIWPNLHSNEIAGLALNQGPNLLCLAIPWGAALCVPCTSFPILCNVSMDHETGRDLPGTFWEQVSPSIVVSSSSQCCVSSPLPALLYHMQLAAGSTEGRKSLCCVNGEASLQGKAEVRAGRVSWPLSVYLHLWRDGRKHLDAEGSQEWGISGTWWWWLLTHWNK